MAVILGGGEGGGVCPDSYQTFPFNGHRSGFAALVTIMDEVVSDGFKQIAA